jgi:Holliday junction resolvase
VSPRRFAARRGPADANQAGIITALRRCGASVVDLHAVGAGCPDLLVGFHGATWLLEVKTAKGLVRESQAAFARDWRGAPVIVVRTVAEALAAIGIQIDR